MIWYSLERDNVDIDVSSGDVDIWLDRNHSLNIPIADWLEIAEEIKIRKAQDGRTAKLMRRLNINGRPIE